jgi:hypothetical protein
LWRRIDARAAPSPALFGHCDQASGPPKRTVSAWCLGELSMITPPVQPNALPREATITVNGFISSPISARACPSPCSPETDSEWESSKNRNSP